MTTRRSTRLGLGLGGGLLAGAAAGLLPACNEVGGLGGDLLEQCGLVCDKQALVHGKFTVSGIADVDAFFSAVLDLSSAAEAVAQDISVELDALYGLVGASGPDDFQAALRDRLSTYVDLDAGFEVRAQPPRCETSVAVTARAAAECDVEATPGSVEVRCRGACSIAADAEAACHAAGGLSCRGTPPDLQCSGTCFGSCELPVAATCDGTCRGTCATGDARVENFEGRCGGACQGSCVVDAGARCDGQCTGTCEFTPPGASCDAGLEARCSATVEADVDCKGDCVGEVEPPQVSAACESVVEAKTEASVECHPPALTFDYRFNAQALADADLRAELRALVNGIQLRYGALLAAVARAEGLLEAGQQLDEVGVAALDALARELTESVELKARFGGLCAIAVLPSAADRIAGAVNQLGGSIEATAKVTAALGR